MTKLQKLVMGATSYGFDMQDQRRVIGNGSQLKRVLHMDILVNLSPWLYLDVFSFIFIFSKFSIIGVDKVVKRVGLSGLRAKRFRPKKPWFKWTGKIINLTLSGFRLNEPKQAPSQTSQIQISYKIFNTTCSNCSNYIYKP